MIAAVLALSDGTQQVGFAVITSLIRMPRLLCVWLLDSFELAARFD
jgi:hypothetical protein